MVIPQKPLSNTGFCCAVNTRTLKLAFYGYKALKASIRTLNKHNLLRILTYFYNLLI